MDKSKEHKRFSRTLGLLGVLLAGGLLHSEPAYAQSPCDAYPSWPQVAHDAQRTGYADETINGTTVSAKWAYAFQPDKVHPQTQPIIYCGKIFVGTEGANSSATGHGARMNVFDVAASLAQQKGVIVKTIDVGGPVLGSVAAGNGYVFFGAMDGAVYLLDAQTGSQLDKVQTSALHGFSSAPVFAEDKFMIGRRDGVFFAYDVNTSTKKLRKLWERSVGAPILQAPAYSNGKVYFGAMDMFVYAINSADGTIAWKSRRMLNGQPFSLQKLDGHAIKEYWPVVIQNVGNVAGIGAFGDVVLVGTYPKGLGQLDDLRLRMFPFRPMLAVNPSLDPTAAAQMDNDWLLAHGQNVEDDQGKFEQQTTLDLNGNPISKTLAQAQDEELAKMDANQSPYYINEPNKIRHQILYAFNAVNGDEAFRLPHWSRPGTHNGSPSPPCAFPAGSPYPGDFVEPMGFIGGDLLNWGRIDINTRRVTDIFYDDAVGLKNDDESYAKTCTRNMVFTKQRTENSGSAYNGAYDFIARRWINIPQYFASSQIRNNTQSAGVSPVAVVGGYIYSLTGHNLIVRTIN